MFQLELYIVQQKLLIATIILWLLSSWVMVIIQYSTENFIFSVDMSRLTVITFELGKHYVQCVIGFYMNYTDWAGAGPRRTRGRGAGTINNSAWSSDKYDTRHKFRRWYLHSSGNISCLLCNTLLHYLPNELQR